MEINELEKLSCKVYESIHYEERVSSENLLLEFVNPKDFLFKSIEVLKVTESSHLQLYLSTQMTKTILDKYLTLKENEIAQVQVIILDLLYYKNLDFQNYVQESFVKLLSLLIKLSWDINENEPAIIYELVNKFFSKEMSNATIVGLKLFRILIEQFCEDIENLETFLDHREKTVHFKGKTLFQIFQIGTSCLKEIKSLIFNENNNNQTINEDLTLMVGQKSFDLLVSCLSFDFLGSNSYQILMESETDTISIPSSWQNFDEILIELVELLFLFYKNIYQFQIKILEVLFHLVSIKNNFFRNKDNKLKFLKLLINGLLEIFVVYQEDVNKNNENLNSNNNNNNNSNNNNNEIIANNDEDQSIIHGLSRIIYKIQFVYPMKLLMEIEPFFSWIEQITKLTFYCFELKILHNAEHYLLEFWSKLSVIIKYLKNNEHQKILKQLVQQILNKWIDFILETIGKEDQNLDLKNNNNNNNENNSSSSRSRSSGGNNSKINSGNEIDNYLEMNFNQSTLDLIAGTKFRPLSEESRFMVTLDSVTQLGLCNYDETTKIIENLFNLAFESYKKTMSTKSGNPRCYIIATSLSIFVTYIGSLIGSKKRKDYYLNNEQLMNEFSICDAKLCAIVFNLIEWNDSFLIQSEHEGFEILETSFIIFLNFFRFSFINNDYGYNSGNGTIYNILFELTNIKNGIHLIEIFINKIINNLKIWSKSELILERTLNLFHKLIQPYSAGAKILKINNIDNLFINHTKFNFPFLNKYILSSKYRIQFYQNIATLLFLEKNEKNLNSNFSLFIKPFEVISEKIFSLINLYLDKNQLIQLTQNERRTIIGLINDLAGVLKASDCKQTYELVFNWLYPNILELLTLLLLNCYNYPIITIQILKFFTEISYNSNNRINFEIWSPNGIYLFKILMNIIEKCSIKLLDTINYFTNFINNISNNTNNTITNSVNNNNNTKNNVNNALNNFNSNKINIYNQINNNLNNNNESKKKYFIQGNKILKCLKLLMLILVRSIDGKYSSIGAFQVYSDDSVKNSIESIILVLLKISPIKIFKTTKLYETFIYLIEILSKDLIEYLIIEDYPSFLKLIQLIIQGFAQTQNKYICNRCCTTLNLLLEFYFKNWDNEYLRNEKKIHLAQILHNHFQKNPNLLKYIFNSVFNIVLFESKSDSWSLSKLFLSLILLEREHFVLIKHQQIEKLDSQEEKMQLELLFDNLVNDIQENLDKSNKIKFKNNLEKFLSQIKKFNLKK
ncbi:exportin 7 [Anaeramoeba flamelloides]|uniref:Exportin 7 n=1 Tax=Anaeramoeba flamelloides TaxID=1746091 RepID=A0ABQ8Y8Z2_9EUKA|nr:exportin 7 [Anaeramoeba flamelloides]